MKPALAKAIIKDIRERGWIEYEGNFYPPNHLTALRVTEVRSKRKPRTTHVKTGWIDDTRNIKNKQCQKDMFMMMIEKELQVEVWPEFLFSTERLYRFDYAIPVLKDGKVVKIAIEQEGGIWAKGNSGHSSGVGIQRDMDKNNLAISQGWVIIRRTPDQMLTRETIELIKSVIIQKSTLL